jgi:hypothetical protein
LAPFSFSLRLYAGSAVAVFRAGFCSVLIYVFVKGGIVNLILLESRDVLIQPFFDFGVCYFVIGVRIGEIAAWN